MKTGNTNHVEDALRDAGHASMEPGHEDREYSVGGSPVTFAQAASMEPGHEDREYPTPDRSPRT